MLSVFPLALVALFVAGRILESEDVERSVVEDLQRLFPAGGGVDAARRAAARARVLDDGRDRRRGRRDLVLEHVLGRARHRLLPHLPPRMPLVGAPEAFRAGDARRRPAVLRRQRDASRRCRPSWSTRRTDLPFGLGEVRGLVYGITLAGGLLLLFALLCLVYWRVPRGPIPWRCIWPGALGARRRDRDRRLRLPALPLQRHARCASARRSCSC